MQNAPPEQMSLLNVEIIEVSWKPTIGNSMLEKLKYLQKGTGNASRKRSGRKRYLFRGGWFRDLPEATKPQLHIYMWKKGFLPTTVRRNFTSHAHYPTPSLDLTARR
jgi:hypothetical protein